MLKKIVSGNSLNLFDTKHHEHLITIGNVAIVLHLPFTQANNIVVFLVFGPNQLRQVGKIVLIAHVSSTYLDVTGIYATNCTSS